MTHEPECFYKGKRDPEAGWYEPEDSPCICEQLQDAYQRGREDAAKDAHAEALSSGANIIAADMVAAAARGDGAE